MGYVSLPEGTHLCIRPFIGAPFHSMYITIGNRGLFFVHVPGIKVSSLQNCSHSKKRIMLPRKFSVFFLFYVIWNSFGLVKPKPSLFLCWSNYLILVRFLFYIYWNFVLDR